MFDGRALGVGTSSFFRDKGGYHIVTGRALSVCGTGWGGRSGVRPGMRKDVLASGVVAYAGTCAPCRARLLGASYA
jgi:hypothetical protein